MLKTVAVLLSLVSSEDLVNASKITSRQQLFALGAGDDGNIAKGLENHLNKPAEVKVGLNKDTTVKKNEIDDQHPLAEEFGVDNLEGLGASFAVDHFDEHHDEDPFVSANQGGENP